MSPQAANILSEADLLVMLHHRHRHVSMGARRWAVAEHIPERPGHIDGKRIADFIAIDCHGSGPWRRNQPRRHEVHGFEVKTSRSDWLTELRDPTKAGAFIPYCHYWWLVVADKTVCNIGELPEGWGLIVAGKAGLRIRHQAVYQQAEPMPPAMVASFARAVAKTAKRQAHVNGLEGDSHE